MLIEQASKANTPSIVTSAGTALAANDNRRYFSIQNVGTNPLFILLGSGASTTVFHAVIKGGTGNDDGLGGSYQSDVLCYQGIVTVAGTSPRFVVTEI